MHGHGKTSVGVLHFIYFVVNYISHPFTMSVVNDQCTAISLCKQLYQWGFCNGACVCYCSPVNDRDGDTDEVVLSQSHHC